MKKYLLFIMSLMISAMSFAQGSGTSADPEVLTESKSFTMPGSGWAHYYFTYTCQLTGVMKWSGNGGFNVGVNADADQSKAYDGYSSDEGKYVQNIDVTEGETYLLDLVMYADDEVKIELPRVIKDGELEKPFNLNDGTVNLGSGAGTVWACYTASAYGKATFSGNKGIVTGIKVFNSLYGAKSYVNSGSESYCVASVEGNSIVAEVEADNTYYVAITKISTPMGNDFSASFVEYKPGESKTCPIDATTSPFEATLAAGAKAWYKLCSTEAGSYKKLAVETDESANVGLGYNYDFGWYDAETFTGSKTLALGTEYYVCEYLVCVENTKDTEIAVKLTVSDYEAGAIKSLAIDVNESLPYEGTAVAGSETWYTLTVPSGSTKDIKVEASAETAKLQIQGEYGSVYAEGLGTVAYTDNAEWSADKVFVKVVNDDAADFTFTITMADHEFAPGERKETAIDITETGVYTFDATTKEVWVKYTPVESATLKVDCNVNFDFYNNIYLYTGETDNRSSLENVNTYSKVFQATAGTTYYVWAKLNETAEGKQIAFSAYTPAEGEYYTTAIEVYKDNSVVVPAGKTVWYTFESTKSGNNVTINSTATGISVKLYSTEANIATDNYIAVSFTDWGEYGILSSPSVEAGTSWLSVYNYQSEDVTLEFTGSLTVKHDHVYAEEWSYTDYNHWRVCIAVDGCRSVSDYAAHEFGEGRVCTVCGYEKPYEHVVADGTASDNRCPFYGYDGDTEGTMTSSIYDASLLEFLEGADITSLKYYLASESAETGATFEVYFNEVEETTLSEKPEDFGTLVYTGEFNYANGSLTIPFAAPYKYNGGNLMVTTVIKEKGTYSQTYWYGTVTEKTVSYCSKGGARTFLPKTAFGYDPTTTGISAVSTVASDNAIYNIAGQKVGNDYKGIVIKNGKKMIVK